VTPRERNGLPSLRSDERGVTLIELMAALVILSLVVLAVLALLATLVRASDLANRETEAEALAIAAADYVKGDGFQYTQAPGVDCIASYQASLDNFAPLPPAPSYLPPGYSARIDEVSYGDTATIAGVPTSSPTAHAENWQAYQSGQTCLAPGPRALKVTVTVSSDEVSRTREVVMRCDTEEAANAGGTC